jgi:sensor histidine kinase YesM
MGPTGRADSPGARHPACRRNGDRVPCPGAGEELVCVLGHIERVRFADRLEVSINLDPNALDGLVPCFLLQPIIENAIRHGIARCEDKGYIETSIQRVGDHMQLCVRDNGPGLNGRSEPGFGVGLTNTRERLFHFYQNDYQFRAFEPHSGGFEVAITIPYERTAS